MSAASAEEYGATAGELARRVVAAAEVHPLEFAKVEGPFDLFSLPGFSCADLAPSLAQACWALGEARRALGKGGRP